jgi:hypothetical protein
MTRDNVVVDVPVDSAECLREILQRLEKELKLTQATIGVGHNPKEADIAVKWALKNCPPSIKLFEDNMVDETPEIKKAENALHGSNDEGAKIMQTLQLIKKHKLFFDALKQSSPNTYNSIAIAIQALAKLVEDKKTNHVQEGSKIADKILKALEKHHEKTMQRHGKDIQKELNRSHEEHSEEKKAAWGRTYMSHKRKEREAHNAIKGDYPMLAHILKKESKL